MKLLRLTTWKLLLTVIIIIIIIITYTVKDRGMGLPYGENFNRFD